MLKKEDLITGVITGVVTSIIGSVIFTLLWPTNINSKHIWNFIFYFVYIGIFAWTLYAFLSKKETVSPIDGKARSEARFGKKIRRINLCIFGVSTFVLAWLIYASYTSVPEPEAFKEGDYGIFVAGFEEKAENPKHTGKSVQGTITSSLNARFSELKIDDTQAREIPVSYIPFFTSHEQARKIGKKYHADLVIWGEITLAGVIPNITVVNQGSESFIIKSETTLLKDTLTHVALSEIKDIRLPALTDEPTMLVAFVTGMKYYSKGDYEKALEYFEKTLPENPTKYIDTAPVFFYIGNIHVVTKEHDKAIADHWESFYSSKSEYDKAIADYNKAIEMDPKLIETYNNKVVTHYSKGEYDKAMMDYNKAIDINPKLAEAYYNRGGLYAIKGEYDKAISDVKKALELKPDNKTSQNFLRELEDTVRKQQGKTSEP
ncbi:MAG: hypothetical protein BWK80_45050 [Desulfobacteraceae bacterium IS3]|nr:MAG: hypothetical protein BWK80_45050 [Desulfobacteraceae bacterium IS3]